MPPTRAWRSCAGYPRAGDRSPAYTEAATNAAPEAVQVADRWHLVKNLAEAVTRFLDQHRADLRRAAPLLDSGGSGEGSLPVLPVVWPPTKGAAEDEYRQRQRGK